MQHAPSEPAKTKPSRYRHNILTKAWFITVRLLSCVVKMHSEGNRCYCWWCDRDSDVETLIYTQNNRPVWWTSVPSITCFFNLFALLYLKFKFWMTLKFSKLSSCLDTVDVILTKGIRKKIWTNSNSFDQYILYLCQMLHLYVEINDWQQCQIFNQL